MTEVKKLVYGFETSPTAMESSIWERHGDKPRFMIEWTIVKMAITLLLEAGYVLKFDHDGVDDIRTIETVDLATMEELFACDEETLYVYRDPKGNICDKFVKFIYGNDGPDVISDYSSSLDKVLKPVNDLADSLM